MKEPGFIRNAFLDIDIVVKEAALRVDDYYLLCDILGLPSRKIFCIREPSSQFSSSKNSRQQY